MKLCFSSLFALGLFTFCAACSGESEQEDAPSSCASDVECTGERICTGGSCVDPSSGGGAGGGTGGGSMPALDCSVECPAKLQSCQAPAQFQAQCSTLCNGLSNDEVLCLKNATCAEVFMLDPQNICGSGGGGTGGGTPDMGGGGGGTPDMGGGGSACPSTQPTCDGDTLVTCEDSGGFPVTTNTTCSRGCQNGACVGPVSSTKIEGSHPGGLEINSFMEPNNQLFTYLSFIADITSNPDSLAGELKVSDASSISINSPDPKSCAPTISLTLNRSEISFMMSGIDDLPSLDCLDFLEDVADDGISITLMDVPELNSSNTVSLELVSR